MTHKYTQEEREFILANYKGITSVKLLEMFNQKFNADLSRSSMKAYLTNHKLLNGVNARFGKGHVPANKGKKIISHPASVLTQFKKGHIPVNHRPVGSERIDNKDGYILVKVAEPNVWRPKHIVVWEKANGPVPKDHRLLFVDQNRQNISLDNLALVSAGQMAILNKRRMVGSFPECNKSAIVLSDLLMKISKKRKKK